MRKKVLYSGQSIFQDNYRVGEKQETKHAPRKVIRTSSKFFLRDENTTRSREEKKVNDNIPTKSVVNNSSVASNSYVREIDTLRIVGKEIDNKYIIKKPIGAGGMGVIYLANHKILQKEYAIKFLYDKNQVYNSDDDELEQRFISEASIAMQLRHNNLVEVYDISKYKNHLYMAMEYINGETIEQAIAQGKSFVEQDVIHVMKEVLMALEVIHAKGYVHRDLKPSNIMINENGVVKLMDFGIAKDLSRSENLTQPNIIIGTLEYMSPEQITDPDNINFASDIYSLGATAQYMLTGKNYIEGNNMQKITAICSGDFLIDIPGVSEEFIEVILRMMHADRKLRFQSAKEVIEVLDLIEKGRE